MDIKRVEIAERAVTVSSAVATSSAVTSSPLTTSSKEAIFWPELDGLRAVACGLVLIAHFNPWIENYISPVLSPIKAIDPGNIGVMLFFALSSFLLTSVCLSEIDRHGCFDLRTFYLRRIFRIWPLYFFMLLLALLVVSPAMPLPQVPGAATTPEQWAWVKDSVGFYAVFLGNWINHTVSEIGILWTICVEEQFYLVLPFVLLLVVQLRQKYIVLVIAVASTTLAILLLSQIPGLSRPYYQTTTYISTFVFGGAAAFVVRRRLLPRIWSGPVPLFGLAILVAILLTNSGFWWVPYGLTDAALYSIVPALLVLLILWVATNSGASHLSALRSPLCRSLGILSYAIYLAHVIVHRLVNLEAHLLELPRAPASLAYHLLFFQYLMVSVFLAALAHGLVERPALKLRKRAVPSTAASAIDARWSVDWVFAAIVAGGLSVLCLLALWTISLMATVR
jgi:peptidoglycan/LPS O-acetylase OafA/YrhL